MRFVPSATSTAQTARPAVLRWVRPVRWVSWGVAGLCSIACGAEADCRYAVCPVNQQACIDHVAEVVGCNLGVEPIRPSVNFLTAEELIANLEASSRPPTAEEQQAIDDHLTADSLLGLMPADYDASNIASDRISGFAAFYSGTTKTITIISDHALADPTQAYLILVHEMVHAYQDAQRGLGALSRAHAWTQDRFLGLRALTEGEAVWYTALADIALDERAASEIDWPGYFARWQSHIIERAARSDTPALDTILFFPYAFGGALVSDAWVTTGPAGIDALYRQPPDSVRQVMGGYAAWPDALRNTDRALAPVAVPILPSDYGFVAGTHESVWMVEAMATRTASAASWAPELQSISADHLSVFRSAQHDVAAVWRIQSAQMSGIVDFLTGPSSWWIEDTQSSSTARHLVTTAGEDLILIATHRGNAHEVLEDIEGWQSPQDVRRTTELNGSDRPLRSPPITVGRCAKYGFGPRASAYAPSKGHSPN